MVGRGVGIEFLFQDKVARAYECIRIFHYSRTQNKFTNFKLYLIREGKALFT